VKRIVTAHAFIEKGELQPLVDELRSSAEFIYQDVRSSLGVGDKAAGGMGLQPPGRSPRPPALKIRRSSCSPQNQGRLRRELS
jgi:acyl-[acyl-carrier-protein]-phospholipid O-acyltransferase/long-chain-fatty-acid--[acyl-carrier-protein] ligase